jgi:hypothetical protein
MQTLNMKANEQLLKQANDPTNPSERSSVKMTFPVDLNQLFTLNYSFDALKSALDYINTHQTMHEEIISRL